MRNRTIRSSIVSWIFLCALRASTAWISEETRYSRKRRADTRRGNARISGAPFRRVRRRVDRSRHRFARGPAPWYVEPVSAEIIRRQSVRRTRSPRSHPVLNVLVYFGLLGRSGTFEVYNIREPGTRGRCRGAGAAATCRIVPAIARTAAVCRDLANRLARCDGVGWHARRATCGKRHFGSRTIGRLDWWAAAARHSRRPRGSDRGRGLPAAPRASRLPVAEGRAFERRASSPRVRPASPVSSRSQARCSSGCPGFASPDQTDTSACFIDYYSADDRAVARVVFLSRAGGTASARLHILLRFSRTEETRPGCATRLIRWG